MRGPRSRIAAARLYVLLDSSVSLLSLEQAARAAIRGGAEILQLRERGSYRALLRRAKRLAGLVHEQGALFLVNDRADIAVAAGADGVHVGADDVPVEAARAVVGEYRVVGATTHSLAEARRAVRSGADYVSVGPMFPTSTKPGLRARGFEYLGSVRRLGVPHFCIGGITAANVRPGMGRVAVCAGVVGRRDVEAAARAIRAKLE